MYTVQEISYGRFLAHRLQDSKGQYLEILSDFGAGINDLVILNKSEELVSVLSGYRSEDDVRLMHHSKFAGSKLSPFPNRVVDGKYSYANKDYQLPVNEYDSQNQLHGLLHNRKFEVIETEGTEDQALLKLRCEYLGVDQGFPFTYTIDVDYILSESGVEIKTSIQNTGDTDMPIADGWHPYFYFKSLNEVALEIGDAERVSSNVGNEIGPENGFEELKPLGTQDFDDCFKLNANTEKHAVKLVDEAQGIALDVWQSSKEGQYSYCQIYTPPTRDQIAIEAVSCPPNALNTKESLITLSPNEEVEMSIGFRLN